MSEIYFKNDKEGGDIFEAIDEGIRDMKAQCGTKKLKKRMFLFTHGMG